MKILFNPIVIRMLVGLAWVGLAFGLGILAVKLLRRSIEEDEAPPSMHPGGSGSDLDLTLAAYQGVIQQYKTAEQEKEKQRQAERQRAVTTENLSEAVLANLSSGVLLFNPMGLVQQANAAAKTILGFASLSGFGAADIFRTAVISANGDAGSPVSDLIARTLRERGALRRVEAEYHTPAGERRVIGLTVSQVNDRGGTLLGTACLISDLTEITDLTRQVRLQENMASLGEMSAGIAHEFKNSLATISGYAQMLAADAASSEAREFGGKIGDETNNLTRIVTDFLNFAKPQGMNRETIALRPMLEGCARDCGIAVDLSGVPADMVVSGDSTALRQVFSNLMRNSVEAAWKDVPIQLVVKAESEDEKARIRLKDNGTGIPQDRLSKIFIPFFTTKSKGTGLGLALVHRIITDHGGTIAVESSDDGTTFTVVLLMREPQSESSS